ncbi:MAG: amidohydrolase family protein [Candidatus Liptonbacteria bacterium]|nr:amidohydrolase family protein [Candidatus Liptonbacteria bacterium]
MTAPWNLKEPLLAAIQAKGGFVNCHAHFDKAFYITKETLDKSMKFTMEEKWRLSDDIKIRSTQEEIETRIRTGLDILVAQGCKATMTFVDAYSAVGHKAIDAALKVREEYKDKIKILIATQPLDGLLTPEAQKLYEEITAKADIAGGLPSKDRPRQEENMDVMFRIAKNLNKPIHAHIDQLGRHDEFDTEKLINATVKHGYEGKVTAIHVVSVSAQPKAYRTEIYKKMAAVGMSVACSPSAMLSQVMFEDSVSPMHNSIANVPEMLQAGVVVGLGVDNVCDFYLPFVDGDMWIELRMLMEACRFYDFDKLVDIATTNGRKLLYIN